MAETNEMKRRLMLISNTFSHEKGYLGHCKDAIRAFLDDITTVTFIPYAQPDWKEYTRLTRNGFGSFDLKIKSVPYKSLGARTEHFMIKLVKDSEAIFVGGGNTFRLLKTMNQWHIMQAIRDRVDEGMPYIGASAGSNVACPTIMTTNDMPIVWPIRPDALNLFPCQINPHFIDKDPNSTHMGEPREIRIAEFLEENFTPVIGLREDSWITVENGVATLAGDRGARIFARRESPVEWKREEPLKLWD